MAFICFIINIDINDCGSPTIYSPVKFDTLEESINYCETLIDEECNDYMDSIDGSDLEYIQDRYIFFARVISLDTMEVVWSGK